MSTNKTIARGATWHLYLEQYYGRCWLKLEGLHDLAELEVVRSAEGDHDVEVSVMLPDDLSVMLRGLL